MTPAQLVLLLCRPFGLILWVIGLTVGYVFGHLWAGLQDGLHKAYEDTE